MKTERGLAPIFIVILILLGIAGFVLYFKTQTLNPQSIPLASSQPTISPTSSPKSAATPSATPVLKIQPKASPTATAKPVYSSRVKLDSVIPNSANSGEEIRILGSGFGTITGKVYLYNQILGPNANFAEVTPNRWTDTEIKITIPPATSGQTVNVEVVHQDGTKSNRIEFKIKGGQPVMDVLSPSNAQPLQEITISGTQFGDSGGTVNIYKADVYTPTPFTQCQVTSWADTSVKCKLPSNVSNGTEYGFEIVSSDNRRSSFKYYKVGN